MEKKSTANRLNQIMKERNLRQVDILEKCKPFCEKFEIKLGRNDLSQYVNGKVEPGQEKLTILGLALNISEAWLMGYDVPMERNYNDVKTESSPQILKYYEKLNDIGKSEATKRVEELTYIKKYTDNAPEDLPIQERQFDNKIIPMMPEDDPRYVNAAHAIDGASEEDIQFDEDIMDDENF